MWVPATKKAIPESSWQYTAGSFFTISKINVDFSIEMYYKQMDNLVEIKEGNSLMWTTEDWQDKIESNGIGKVYGIEFLFQKNFGKINCWLSYSLSKNTRQFENLNLGKEYHYVFDRTHDFSIVFLYSINNKISLSANWVYMTGNLYTISRGSYNALVDIHDFDGNKFFYTFKIYDEKNNKRMPPIHRLDIGVNFVKNKKNGSRTWSINIYNAYNRMNAYTYYLDNIYENGKSKTVMKQFTLFPLIPSVSYTRKFN